MPQNKEGRAEIPNPIEVKRELLVADIPSDNEGVLEGLVVAEVEFADEVAAACPEWASPTSS